MRSRELVVVAFILLLVGETLQWSTAANNASSSSSEKAAFQETQMARALIEKLNAVANFTDDVIKSSASSPSSGYASAEAYRKKALEEYRSEDYRSAISDAMQAMHYYREVLSLLKENGGAPKENAQAKLLRTRNYLNSVAKLIKFAKSRGLDVGNVTDVYTQMKAAYEKAAADVRAGKSEELPADLRMLETKRMLLESALARLRALLMERASARLVESFLVHGEMAINLAQNLTKAASGYGVDVGPLQARLTAFERVYDQVLKLKDTGNYDEALKIIQENRRTIAAFQAGLSYTKFKLRTEGANWTTVNVETFINETSRRVQNDGKSLEALRKKGVNTRIAELQLNAAGREFSTGLILFRDGRAAEAKRHFLTAEILLNRVELFIRAHSQGG